MANYESNSDASKEKKKDIQPIALKGEIVKTKKTGLQKIASTVSDNLEKNDVKGRIINDIILPTILEMVYTGLSGMFGIDSAKLRNTTRSVVNTVKSSDYWNAGNNTKEPTKRYRTVYDFDNPVLSMKADAEDFLMNLEGYFDQYRVITVSDIRQLLGQVPTSSDFNYGWRSMNDICIVHVAEGWMIRMPRPEPI